MRKLAITILLFPLAACSSKLETGYEPKKLDMGLAQRQSLYADPYSSQAAEAQEDNSGGSVAHTPGRP
jgi:hypothetical protein